MYFPDEVPDKWCWGKPLPSTAGGRLKKGQFWNNYTADGEDYEQGDHVITNAADLTQDNYKEVWAVLAPEAFNVGALE